MIKRDIVVIGASAGGLEALRVLIGGLPADFPAAVLIVWHISPESHNLAPQILDRFATLPVEAAQDNAPIEPGHIYFAVPDRHLLVTPGHLRVAYGPKENRFRPSIDALFRSAAYAYGPRVIGVILTGMLDDGTAGLWTIKDRGGLALVQDPLEAAFASMPQTAAQYVKVDAQVPIAEMAAKLVEFTAVAVPRRRATKRSSIAPPARWEPDLEMRIAQNEDAIAHGVLAAGEPTLFVCPECEGVLLRLKGGGIPRFRCHTGHAYSIHSLVAEVNKLVEQKLWSATRAVEESGLLMQHLAEHIGPSAHPMLTGELTARAHSAERSASLLRQLLAASEPDRQAATEAVLTNGRKPRQARREPRAAARAPAKKKATRRPS